MPEFFKLTPLHTWHKEKVVFWRFQLLIFICLRVILQWKINFVCKWFCRSWTTLKKPPQSWSYCDSNYQRVRNILMHFFRDLPPENHCSLKGCNYPGTVNKTNKILLFDLNYKCQHFLFILLHCCFYIQQIWIFATLNIILIWHLKSICVPSV